MILEYRAPINEHKDIQPQIQEAVKVFKDMKKIIIAQAISAHTGVKYNFDDMKDKITHTHFENTTHVFYYTNKPMLKFTPSEVDQTDTEIVCTLEYVRLYQENRS